MKKNKLPHNQESDIPMMVKCKYVKKPYIIGDQSVFSKLKNMSKLKHSTPKQHETFLVISTRKDQNTE